MEFERDLFDQSHPHRQGVFLLNQFKSLDKSCHFLRRGNKNIAVYATSSQGSDIKNAETGEFSKSVVGTLGENLFYKVTIATGEYLSGPLTLFYTSPSHYEKHQGVIVSEDIKFKWNLKYLNTLKDDEPT